MIPEKCPSCHSNLIGQPIPEAVKHHYGGQEFYMRVISIYDRDADRHDHWKCPECGHEWWV